MLAIAFPAIDPVAFEIGPVAIRWYALSYLVGFILGWRYAIWLAKRTVMPPTPRDLDDFLTWAVIGTILGGRLGYILFYNFNEYLADPIAMLRVWEGGMAFHGGLAGVIIAMILFARARKIPFFALGDIMATVGPVGLLLGRLANFVNGELWGRPTDLPWGMVFPGAGDAPRHPSQLYEAFLEGVVLLIVLHILARRPGIRAHPGILSGVFLAGYGICRFLVEFVREPDAQLGFLWLGATMGQLLSIPMIVIGAGMIWWAAARPPVVAVAR